MSSEWRAVVSWRKTARWLSRRRRADPPPRAPGRAGNDQTVSSDAAGCRLRGRTGAAASGAHRHATQERRRSSAEARTAAIVEGPRLPPPPPATRAPARAPKPEPPPSGRAPVPPPIHAVAIPDVETITLPNGMKLYLLEDHELPLVQGRSEERRVGRACRS